MRAEGEGEMREIKFRAWDNVLGKWVSPQCSWKRHELYVGFLEEDFIEIMQFTGLHDRNGKEIWESDIVRFLRAQGYWSHNRGDISVVKWIDDQQAQYCGFGFSPLHPLTINKAKKVEVIGNIYSNPELLK